MSKPRLQGSELRLQQHFRWVTLRWDQEPLHGLLGRHLRRKVLGKVRRASNELLFCLFFFLFLTKLFHRLQTGTGVWSPDGAVERSALWVSQVWQQLNACLSRLGTHEALLGPRLFLSCPLLLENTQTVVRLVEHHTTNQY